MYILGIMTFHTASTAGAAGLIRDPGSCLPRDASAPLWLMQRANGLVLIHPNHRRRQHSHQTFRLTNHP